VRCKRHKGALPLTTANPRGRLACRSTTDRSVATLPLACRRSWEVRKRRFTGLPTPPPPDGLITRAQRPPATAAAPAGPAEGSDEDAWEFTSVGSDEGDDHDQEGGKQAREATLADGAGKANQK
jgi:hypothetical protein